MKKINKKNLFPVLVALFTFGVQTQNVVAGPGTISSPAILNTESLSALLNKYAGLIPFDRDTLRSTDEYNYIVDAVKAMTSTDIMKLDLTQMLSPMKNFMFSVPENDTFACAIKGLFYGYASIDTRNVNGFWQNASADSLKNSFNAMRDLNNDTHTYNAVWMFYNNLSPHLMNFIVEYKDGAEFASKAIKDRKFSDSYLSYNAKSMVKDFEKKLESDAAAEKITAAKKAESDAETEMKSATMDQLAKAYEEAYSASNFSESNKIELIFNEKLSEEKANFKNGCNSKSFKELMELQDELYKKNSDLYDYDAVRKDNLVRKWLKAQVEVVGEVLLPKLLLEPEYIRELSRRNDVNDRIGFNLKLHGFVQNNSSKLKDHYKKEHQGKSHNDLLDLIKPLHSPRTENIVEHEMTLIQKPILKDLISKGSNSVAAPSPDFNVKPAAVKAVAAAKIWHGSNVEAYDSEDGFNAWSKKKLNNYLNNILPSKWAMVINQVLNNVNDIDDTIIETKKQDIFNALLNIKPDVFSKKLRAKKWKIETKYGVVQQFVHRAFTEEDSDFETFNEKILEQACRDFKIVPLEKFSVSLSDMYAECGLADSIDPDLQDSIEDAQKELQRAVYKIYDSPITVAIKKDILSAYVTKIACFVRYFEEDSDGLNRMEIKAKEAGLKTDFIKKMLTSSRMNNKDDDYIAVKRFADSLVKAEKNLVKKGKRVIDTEATK